MNAPVPPAATSQPNSVRDRIRLLALLVLVALWTLPTWVTTQVADGVSDEKGAVRSGIAAALALIALWGLAATSLAARRLAGLRIGGALTDAVIALATTGLLVAGHPWIPGGDLREAWVPIFGPLALLAALDALVAWKRAGAGHEISVIRAGAALFAATALAIDGQWIPAGIALWLTIAPLMFLRLTTPRSARRSLETFALVAAAVAGLAPWIHCTAVGWNSALGSPLTVPVYLWCITAAFLVTTAIDGVMRPEADAESA
jgi:hypothetical protein